MTFTEMAFFPANFMLQNPHEDDHHQTPSAVNVNHIIPSCTPQDIHGFPPSSLFGVNVASLGAKRGMSFSGIDVVEEANGEEDLSDDGSQTGEKKRRLNMEQVKTLENNFELGNKLEPERKMKLARALGLQPRQIAIWFQNRRARWKTKQLEKDYELLKKQFDVLKAENEALQEQNFKLQSEVLALKSREAIEAINLNKEIHDQGSCSTNTNGSENSSDVKLDVSGASPATNSPSSNHPVSRSDLFPTPSSVRPVPQLIFQKTELHHQPPSKEESFCNMFCGIDEQSGLWPWLEQQHFH